MTNENGLIELGEATELQKEMATSLLLELLQLLDDMGGPFHQREGGDLYCDFCLEWQFDLNEGKHEPDCFYVRAKNLLQKTKGEN